MLCTMAVLACPCTKPIPLTHLYFFAAKILCYVHGACTHEPPYAPTPETLTCCVHHAQEVFGRCGALARLVLPPTRTLAIVEFAAAADARRAFQALAYKRFQAVPLYLEWAPRGIFSPDAPMRRGQVGGPLSLKLQTPDQYPNPNTTTLNTTPSARRVSRRSRTSASRRCRCTWSGRPGASLQMTRPCGNRCALVPHS